MTGRPPRYTPELAETILRETAQGAFLTEICARPGMPCDNTVRQWIKDDIDGFAARFAAAQEAGKALVQYRTCYTPEIAEKIARGRVAGRTLAEICSEPGMPCIKTVHNWAASDREGFGQVLKQAEEVGRALNGGPVHYSREIAERLLCELMAGRPVIDVCNDPGMPAIRTVMLWVQRNEDGFAARYHEARQIGGHIMIEEMLKIGDDLPRGRNRHSPPGEAAEPAATREEIDVAQLRSDQRRWTLSRALPRLYGGRLQIEAKHEAGDSFTEMLKQIDGQSRRLPKRDEPADE